MKTAKKHFKSLLLLFGCSLAIATIIISGCKKEEPSTTQPTGTQNLAAKTEQPVVTAAAQIEQKFCPVMADMKIDPEIYTEYEGKKVYFCCTDCKAKFEADPAKYAANLPQFKK
jgi:YHS domain-containing protein